MFEVIIGQEYPKKVIPLINGAINSIHIIVYDWRWYPNDIGCACQRFNAAIIAAAKKKVKVKAMTSVPRVVALLNSNSVEAKKPRSKRLLHTKLMLIDEKIAILGSHNYTQNAFTMNQEVSVIIRGRDNVSRFLDYFKSVWQS